MSRFRRIEIVEPRYSPVFVREASLFTPKALSFPSFVIEEEARDLSFALDLLYPKPPTFELVDAVTDLVKRSSAYTYERIYDRFQADLCLQTLSGRVSELESKFDRLANAKINGGDRKYTWTAEIKGPATEKKYKWVAEIKGGEDRKKEEKVKNYKWTAEIKGKGEEEIPISRKYTFETSSGFAGDSSKLEKKEKVKDKKQVVKKEKKGECSTRLVEIEESPDRGAIVLRQAFAKRAGVVVKRKGKKKELSPADAALLIQMTFREYLIRRSQSLRALRELAVAKNKLKELRALFNNFSYRSQVARDAEERQRFSEKIIVLLLTVDAIEGADLLVRPAKRSMVDELEAMLDVVDPQPAGGKSLSMRRRTFDMPDSVIQKEIAEGVAQVVQMLNNED